MASELERIANRLRVLSAQAARHQREISEASTLYSRTAADIAQKRFPTLPDGVERTPPLQLVSQLYSVGRRAQSAIGPLQRTSELLKLFAAGLAGGGAPIAEPVPVPGLDPTAGFTRPDTPPPAERPAPPSPATRTPEPVEGPEDTERADQSELERPSPESERAEGRLRPARGGSSFGRWPLPADRSDTNGPDPALSDVPDLPQPGPPVESADDGNRRATQRTTSVASSSTEATADVSAPSYE
jgi:hypothetical protein